MDSDAPAADASADVEMKAMRDQLMEFGLEDENLSKEEMVDLLKALNNSKSSVKEDELLRQNVEVTKTSSPEKTLKRRYLNVRDRRLPWSLFPNDLTNAEKARALAAYIKLMSINNYRQARQTVTFASWPPPMHIVEESNSRSLRSTRSGRSVPVYCDDDSSDIDFVVVKPKKRKVSNSETNEGVYSNKVVSLKRKPSKEDHRPIKELKLSSDSKVESVNTSGNAKGKRDFFTIIED
ncbi:uncharacterized protein LOC105390379 [Plutella xylostella]|uniref:uncharacterized protein LOC105390379 n=1 Tax=Plutella xylostella TaxID=51655 RepID=UPI002032CD31|nr:uncharacterized protein LOC105390379 [Plutella xylostella]